MNVSMLNKQHVEKSRTVVKFQAGKSHTHTGLCLGDLWGVFCSILSVNLHVCRHIYVHQCCSYILILSNIHILACIVHVCVSCFAWVLFMLYVQQQYSLHAHSSIHVLVYEHPAVDVLAVAKPRYLLCRSSRSIPRPNTLTLSCILPCKSLRDLS